VRAHCKDGQQETASGRVEQYLYLEQVIATDALVVHLMVSIIRVPTIFVLNESEAGRQISIVDGMLESGQSLTVGWKPCVVPECHSGLDVQTLRMDVRLAGRSGEGDVERAREYEVVELGRSRSRPLDARCERGTMEMAETAFDRIKMRCRWEEDRWRTDSLSDVPFEFVG